MSTPNWPAGRAQSHTEEVHAKTARELKKCLHKSRGDVCTKMACKCCIKQAHAKIETEGCRGTRP
eukprot:1155308-Pelagomonas_calceolata.AAC.4